MIVDDHCLLFARRLGELVDGIKSPAGGVPLMPSLRGGSVGLMAHSG
jgi:hypothetical protein